MKHAEAIINKKRMSFKIALYIFIFPSTKVIQITYIWYKKKIVTYLQSKYFLLFFIFSFKLLIYGTILKRIPSQNCTWKSPSRTIFANISLTCWGSWGWKCRGSWRCPKRLRLTWDHIEFLNQNCTCKMDKKVDICLYIYYLLGSLRFGLSRFMRVS